MSAHEPQLHPYHLVNPSAWPLLSSLALLLLAIGALFFMHDKPGGTVILSVGLLSVLSCMFVWWRDVLKEGSRDKAHTGPVQHGLRLGMALFIVSEIMFFVAFFWAFFNASLAPVLPWDGMWPASEKGIWPPAGVETLEAWDLPFLNTLILLLSGTTVTWAHHALLEGNQKGLRTGLLLTVLLGLTFTGLQAVEYGHAMFGFKDGIYSSTFYMATGFHGFHVIVGTIFLAVCWVRSLRGTLTKDHHLGLEFAAWYWHFVDVVWLFLFVSVYWWGGA